MKTGTHFILTTLVLVGVLLTASPGLALPNDGMPHNDINSGNTSTSPGQCTSHMSDPTQLGAPVPVFKLCHNNSGTQLWSLEIRSDVSPNLLVSGCSWGTGQTPTIGVSTTTFSSPSCTIPTSGYYRAIIKYCVTNPCGSVGSHTDRRFHR
jgi:hypothetical protein